MPSADEIEAADGAEGTALVRYGYRVYRPEADVWERV